MLTISVSPPNRRIADRRCGHDTDPAQRAGTARQDPS